MGMCQIEVSKDLNVIETWNSDNIGHITERLALTYPKYEEHIKGMFYHGLTMAFENDLPSGMGFGDYNVDVTPLHFL